MILMGYLGFPFRSSALVAGIGSALFALACLSSIFGALMLGRIISTAGSIRATLALQNARALSLLALVDQETGLRGYVATGKPQFLDVYQSGASAYALAIKRFAGSSPSVDAGIVSQHSATLDSSALEERFLKSEIALVRSGHAALARVALTQGKTLFDRVRADESQVARALDARLRNDRLAFQGELDFALDSIWVSGAVLFLLGIALAFSVRAIRRIEGQANLDELTGLANRRMLSQRIKFQREYSGVILLDLDEFKRVNDHYGHQIGDALLIAVARRLQAAVRGGDLVARLGGDEFAIVFASDEAAALVARVQAVFSEPFVLTDHLCLIVGCSIGVGVPAGGQSGVDLIRLADERMFADKRGRRAVLDPRHRRPATRSSIAL